MAAEDSMQQLGIPQQQEQRRFVPIDHLSTGAHGFVQLTYDALTESNCAVKYIQRSVLQKSTSINQEFFEHCQLSRARHPHLVRVHETFLTPSYVGIAMEYVQGADLHSYLEREGRLQEGTARLIFQQIILAVDFSLKVGVPCRDLKLGNFLLELQPRPDIPLVKLLDFGVGKYNMRDNSLRNQMDAPLFAAPEILMSLTRESVDPELVTIYSCGIILYMMLFGCHPFLPPSSQQSSGLLQPPPLLPDVASIDWHKLVDAVSCGLVGVPKSCESAVSLSISMAAAMDLLQRMLCPQPHHRMKVSQLLQHPWFLEGLPVGALALNEKFCLAAVQQFTSDGCNRLEQSLSQVQKALLACLESNGSPLPDADQSMILNQTHQPQLQQLQQLTLQSRVAHRSQSLGLKLDSMHKKEESVSAALQMMLDVSRGNGEVKGHTQQQQQPGAPGLQWPSSKLQRCTSISGDSCRQYTSQPLPRISVGNFCKDSDTSDLTFCRVQQSAGQLQKAGGSSCSESLLTVRRSGSGPPRVLNLENLSGSYVPDVSGLGSQGRGWLDLSNGRGCGSVSSVPSTPSSAMAALAAIRLSSPTSQSGQQQYFIGQAQPKSIMPDTGTNQKPKIRRATLPEGPAFSDVVAALGAGASTSETASAFDAAPWNKTNSQSPKQHQQHRQHQVSHFKPALSNERNAWQPPAEGYNPINDPSIDPSASLAALNAARLALGPLLAQLTKRGSGEFDRQQAPVTEPSWTGVASPPRSSDGTGRRYRRISRMGNNSSRGEDSQGLGSCQPWSPTGNDRTSAGDEQPALHRLSQTDNMEVVMDVQACSTQATQQVGNMGVTIPQAPWLTTEVFDVPRAELDICPTMEELMGVEELEFQREVANMLRSQECLCYGCSVGQPCQHSCRELQQGSHLQVGGYNSSSPLSAGTACSPSVPLSPSLNLAPGWGLLDNLDGRSGNAEASHSVSNSAKLLKLPEQVQGLSFFNKQQEAPCPGGDLSEEGGLLPLSWCDEDGQEIELDPGPLICGASSFPPFASTQDLLAQSGDPFHLSLVDNGGTEDIMHDLFT